MLSYLIQMGHRRIALLKTTTPLTEKRGRANGDLDALAEAGLPVDQGLMINAHFKASEARQAVPALIVAKTSPTAIVGSTDTM
ncbi:LacI family transcriptional regulator [Mesobaculum littorinae]|uniref:LacI family transcriptional regulator n=1 Tax=Mesobaculum littorinae TaxID=2486419 RepID=A0A438AEU7_9RHOB|nr:substrate-binding domain-containing protein [Mesobaculum littorinae]RVV97214.1 LacI family transcriptional regulator [Mesobaculum littorinae]